MKLDQAQRQRVNEWIEAGLKVSEIQNKLATELGVGMTYMEVRFLLDDLKLKPKEQQPPVTAAPIGQTAEALHAAPPAGQAEQTPEPADDEAGRAVGISLTVDQIARPGALVSGKVTFSDGKAAAWYLDQMGRLGLVPQQQGYRPSQEDLLAFQTELQNQLAKLGF